MLPKVNRDDALNHNSEPNGITGTNKVVQLLSAVAPADNGGSFNSGGGRGAGGGASSKGGRRPISTRSAHLTTIPLEATFLSPKQSLASSAVNPASLSNHQNRPYLPYSASSPTRTRQTSHRVQTNQQKWKGDQNGYKSEYSSYIRARAHSHRSTSSTGKTWSARGAPAGDKPVTKSMPYLVPKTAKTRTSSTSSKMTSSSSDQQQQQSNEEKVVTKPGELQTSAMHLVGGMVMMGTGKPGVAMNGSSGSVSSSLTKDRVQVCRTKEEREKNPDTIRLDKRGVRVFPDIGGGESSTLKLLSLQHNLITRLENVPLLSQLVVLDLYDNRVERICGLQGLPSLRVLLLGKNRIKRIEGLDSLKRLEILDLHGNQLRYVDNLGSLSALRVLNLAGNLLRNIRNLGPYGMSSLTELNLKRNRIKNLDGLQKAPHLKKLLLANNDLQNISTLAPLRKLLFLNELVVDPNPLIGAIGSEYQSQVLTLFPNLGSLDRNPISDEMKQEARLWHRKKLEEEERRKEQEERLRQEMAQTVGPPGSREQVIYQARRRWESLRNFVKSSNNNNGPIVESSTNNTNGKKSNMKSMKKVVTVATELKAKKQAEQLYPPATLDLEEFPDGQENLDQTKSLLGSQGQEVSHTGGKGQTEHGDNENSHTAPSPKGDFPSISQTNRDNHLSSNEVDTKTEIIIEDTEAEAKAIPRTGSRETLITISTHGNFNEEEELLQPKDYPLIENSGSARSNSAKVAVVRPLVHRSDTGQQHVEIEVNTPKESDSEQMCVENTDIMSSAVTASSGSNHQNICEVLVAVSDSFTDKRLEEENCDREATLENDSNVDYTKDVIEPVAQSMVSVPIFPSPVSVTHIDHEDEMKTTHEQIIHQELAIQNESARVKSKLLKHLRSISLDSYPHPFLRPGGQQSGGDTATAGGGCGSSINSASPMIPSDDDDGGEEDDDNDNEVVQDYDCDDDDAYSIATSTCTTVTSGSTPRRSSTVMATTNRLLKNGVLRKHTFPRTRSQRIKLRDRAAKLFGSTSDLSPRSTSGSTTSKRVNSGTGTRGNDSTNGPGGRTSTCGRILRRCDSAVSLSTSGLMSSTPSSTLAIPSTITNGGSRLTSHGHPGGGNDTNADQQGGVSPFRKQGMDFLVEVEGKMLNVFGQGGLRHALTAFASNVTCHVFTAKFHYISYDSIIPFFGKLRQVYPSLEHFHFRANNLCTLAQLDALSDLQGLTSLFIAKEGNPVVNHEAWAHYASYRLSHWGLQVINGKEVCSEYRGGANPTVHAKGFESLGFLALSCLPQTALTPLAKRLHMLHCFCCCSPSTSSDESNRRLANQHHSRLLHSPSQPTTDHASNNFCTAWDDDPVLLDVIGKEALVYCPPILPPEITDTTDNNSTTLPPNATKPPLDPLSKSSIPPTTSIIPNPPLHNPSIPSSHTFEKRRAETLGHLVNSGVEIVEKVDMLEKTWPTLMTQVIQEILMDFRFMDSYMKKELKKCQDLALINQQHQQQQPHYHHHQNPRKIRH